jgi:hypothetical protein
MPSIDLSILNQRQTPAFYADTLTNRPAAGFVGRIFVSTDTFAFYRDNGTSWDLIGGPGTGTVTGSGAVNQVTYWNGTSTITGDNGLYYDSTNDFLGIGTATPGASIDVHSTINVIAQLNQLTATNNSLLAFQNASAGLWRIGNYYNAGANDFGVFDVIGAIQPLTIKKTTGQVLIGTSTVGGGKLVVSSATADNGVQIVGANAPSLRLDDAVTGATKRAGLGISTAVNNFIQGSADRDFCIFNGSTTASPILFGVYNGTNIQEAARISTARNFLIGSTTDTGQAFQVTGTTLITNGTVPFIITNKGNIGVGNTTPTDYQIFGFGPTIETRGGVGGVFITRNTAGTILGSFTSDSGNSVVKLKAETNHALAFSTNDLERARITNAGFFGIGTTNPLDNFVVSNAGANSLSFDVTFSSGASLIYSYNRSTSVYTNLIIQGLNTIFKQGTTEYMRIKSTGIVNIVNTPVYATNALAIAGGLAVGDIYKSATGVLSIVY